MHPRAAALARAGVRIEQVQADGAPVLVVHLEHARVGVPAPQIGSRGEREAVQLLGRGEHAPLENTFELEVGTQGLQVDVVISRSDLLGVVRVIPRLDRVHPVLARRGG